MATRDYTVMKRTIVVLGTTGAGKSSVANHIMTDAGQRPVFEVSSKLGIVRKQAEMAEMEITARRIRYHIKTVDTHGFLDTGGKSTNSQDLATIKEFLKDKVPEGVSLVIFVFKKGPYTNQEKTTLQFFIDNFRKEVSDISALVVTCCEDLDEHGRRSFINDIKTNAETKSMIEFMGKGIFPVGFPPMKYLNPKLCPLYEEDVAADRKKLRELVFDCDKMYLSEEIWRADFWQRYTIL